MRKISLSANIAYSVLGQILFVATPLITTPYVARVLSPELIGDYSYVLANSSYFVLAECLGYSLYGQVKAASIRDDKEKLSALFWEITFSKALLMCICLLVYFCALVPFSSSIHQKLYFIVAMNIISNGIDATWILNGLEEFKVTALRSMIIRLINVAAILLFVRSEGDIYKYAFIMQFTILAGFCAVLPYIYKLVKPPVLKKLSLIQHIKPSLVFFIPGIIHTIFSAADKTMLGIFTENSYEIGVYEQANKICLLCMDIICAFSNVILPRTTYLYHNSNDDNKVKDLIAKSLQAAMSVALPCAVGVAIIADRFVPFFFGARYEKTALLLKILCFNVLFTVLSNFCGQQCLIAREKQAKYNIAVSMGAVFNVILNAVMVSRFASIGVSFASVLSSAITCICILYFSNDVITVGKFVRKCKKYLIAVSVMAAAVLCLKNINMSDIWVVFFQILTGVLTYCITLFVLKDEIVLSVYYLIRKKIRGIQQKGET